MPIFLALVNYSQNLVSLYEGYVHLSGVFSLVSVDQIQYV